jgi:hypothetical protein
MAIDSVISSSMFSGRRLRRPAPRAAFPGMRVAELHLRHVDGHHEVAVALFAVPVRGSAVQHPFARSMIRPEYSAIGMKRSGEMNLPSGVCQRSGSGAHPAGADAVDRCRLVHHENCHLAKRRAQRVHHAHAFADFDAHAARE